MFAFADGGARVFSSDCIVRISCASSLLPLGLIGDVKRCPGLPGMPGISWVSCVQGTSASVAGAALATSAFVSTGTDGLAEDSFLQTVDSPPKETIRTQK